MAPISQPDRIYYVSHKSICKLYNESQYPDMVARKLLRKRYIANDHLRHKQRDKVNEPRCTRSQKIRYYKGRQWVVEVHQYKRRDGTIGASGKPDPKRLRIGNKIYILDIDYG